MENEMKNLGYHEIYDIHFWLEDSEQNIIKIPLINKRRELVDYAIADLDKKDLLLQYSYRRRKNCYKNKNNYYAISNIYKSMHEIVIGGKAPDGHQIDHRNHNGIDNRGGNLRYVSIGLNNQNKQKKEGTSSQYIGVSIIEETGKWRGLISYKYERFHLGVFENEIDAAIMYDVHATYLYRDDGEPKTNGLLDNEQTENIKKYGIPEQYKLKEKSEKDLPTNIYLTEFGTFFLSITRNYERFNKTFKTLEEAIVAKEDFLKKIDENLQNSIEEITRNDEGKAIIKINSESYCIVDDHVWHDVSRFSWNCYTNETGKINIYPAANVKGKITRLHKYIYKNYIGDIPKGMSIDHKVPGNVLDVRTSNLRLADKSLQGHNRNKMKGCFDVYRGIVFSGNSYSVIINNKYYGGYSTAEDAAERANEIYVMIYGEKAYLNIIDWSKRTTKYNRIPENLINEEFIMNLTKVIDVWNVAFIKQLGTKNGGDIPLKQIKLENLEHYKKLIVSKLYYSQNEIIRDDGITKEYVLGLKRVQDIKKLVKDKKLNKNSGGEIAIDDINAGNVNKYKNMIVKSLFEQEGLPKKSINGFPKML